MLISEQKHTNLNRKYYHGKVLDKKGNEFYLTTRFAYAFIYANGILGDVEEYTLKQTADIFNTQSKTDEGNLRKYCQKYEPKLLSYIPSLKYNDWTSLGDPRLKVAFIYIIKDLGYDGFFNFEIDKKSLQDMDFSIQKRFQPYQNSPSIAVFNKKVLELKKVWTKSNFTNNKYFIELREEELQIIENTNFSWQSRGHSKKEIFNHLKQIILTIPISELYDLLGDYPEKQLQEYKKHMDEYISFLAEKIDKTYKSLELYRQGKLLKKIKDQTHVDTRDKY